MPDASPRLLEFHKSSKESSRVLLIRNKALGLTRSINVEHSREGSRVIDTTSDTDMVWAMSMNIWDNGREGSRRVSLTRDEEIISTMSINI